jgi:hypothetical protein
MTAWINKFLGDIYAFGVNKPAKEKNKQVLFIR